VNQIWAYAREHPSKMEFNAIFSQAALAACLKYPSIEGLEEEVPVEVKVPLKRKRMQILSKALEPMLPEAKKQKPSATLTIRLATKAKEKKTSKVPREKVPELLRKPATQPSPRK
jgi:hypothetical protein